ncbi:hypothetical protein PENTCL1PPCAC_17237, partial [Pristionchus entomophagus]
MLSSVDLPVEETATKTRRTPKEFFVKYFLAGQKTHEDEVESGVASPFDNFVAKYRKAIGILIPMIFVQTFYWLLAFENGFWRLFATRYEMSLVMMFGAAVGGATAEGGGAIAFPVLTLAFKVPATTARDFAFMIQTVGMNSAAITVLLMGLLVEKHTLILASIGGSVGTILCLEFLDHRLPPDLKKMIFVSVFFSFAIALFLLNSDKKRKTFDKIQNFDLKKSILLVIVGFVGGVFSGISGSGLDVFSFSVITLLFRVNEKVATPTTVSLAGINSAVGFFWRHQMQHAIQPLAWEYFAVCVPIVSIFAPLGSFISSHFHRQTLAIFIYILETVAIVSAFVIIQPDLTLSIISVSFVVVGFLFYYLLAFLGRRFISQEHFDSFGCMDDSICPLGPLILGYSADYFPYIYKQDNGQFNGVFYDLYRVIAKDEGCDGLELRKFPAQRISSEYEVFDGAIDRREVLTAIDTSFLRPTDLKRYRHSTTALTTKMMFMEQQKDDGLTSDISFYAMFPANIFILLVVVWLIYSSLEYLHHR